MNCHDPVRILPFFRMMIGIITAAALFTGCGSLKNEYTEKQKFWLCVDCNEPTPADQDNRSQGVPLVVNRLDISPEFDGQEFIYRVDENRFTQDYYNTYITPPARMITDVILEALVDSPQFAPVPKNMAPDNVFQLWGKITALYCDQRNASQVSAVVDIALNLDRLNKESVTQVVAKTYSAKIPLGSDTSPKAYIEALNRGLATIVNDLLSDFKQLPSPADK